jgi:hypothetical protein
MRLTRSVPTTVAGVMSVAAAATLTTILLAPVTKVSPTPEELAERFTVFADEPETKRILAMDANGDTYVARHELPERMHNLMRGDQNGDGFLSPNEVRVLVDAASRLSPRMNGAPPPPPPPQLPHRQQRTTMVDVVRDQKLPQAKHDFAMALLKNPVVAASSDLYVRLREVLDREEYDNFKAAATRAGLLGFGRQGTPLRRSGRQRVMPVD